MDTVAEFLTRVRNAGSAKHEKVDLPASNLRLAIAKVLVDQGFVRSVRSAKDSKQGVMRVYLKYTATGEHAINSIDRVSRPGRRVYVKSDELMPVKSGLGISIISTPKGILSGDEAKKMNVGGELLCKVW